MNPNDYIRLDKIRLDKKGGAGGNVENTPRLSAKLWPAPTIWGEHGAIVAASGNPLRPMGAIR